MVLTGGKVQPPARKSAVVYSSVHKTVKWLNGQHIASLVGCLTPHRVCIKLSIGESLLHFGREIV